MFVNILGLLVYHLLLPLPVNKEMHNLA